MACALPALCTLVRIAENDYKTLAREADTWMVPEGSTLEVMPRGGAKIRRRGGRSGGSASCSRRRTVASTGPCST